ncbi:F-box protein CPR1-like [Silene latifolia]|uniref:F-box protein CPR1-like n=1 Tax=Silene latifolia TaxID=37657 RepID=UPI003D7877F5
MASNLVTVLEKPIEPPITSFLPIDLIHAEILPKLPPKSLIRFKTVCKSFNAIISSPEFIHLHLCHSRSSSNRFLVTNSTPRTTDMYDLDSQSSVPTATFSWPWDTSILGSCNGLLLLTINCHYSKCLHLVLLNPSTRTYVELHSDDKDVVEGNIGFGFGFDDSNNDYKIVVVSDMSDSSNTWRVTTVYSVNLESWKVVDRSLTSDSMKEQIKWYNGILINNHLLHWIFETEFWNYQRIGCFDVISEEWILDVRFPDYYYDRSNKGNFLDLGVLDGYLFTSFVNRVGSLFDVWVMKEYGVQESWIKLLSINIGNDPSGEVVPIAKLFNESMVINAGTRWKIEIPGGVIPVACRRPGSSEVLLRNRIRSNKLFWYNWVDNAIIKPKIPSVWRHQPYFVKESLVRLPNTNPNLLGDMYQPDLFASHLQR